MRWAYRVLQAPTNYGTGAFLPQPARSWSAVMNGQNLVSGAPGTMPVSAPRPAALNDGQLGGAYNQPSSVAPDVIYPSIYVAHVNPTMTFPGLGTGLTRGNDHPMPVPAETVAQLVGMFMHRVRVGGRTVTSAVRPFTQWPTYRRTPN